MLSKRQNLWETITGGHPDRFVNQFEYMTLLNNPVVQHCCSSCRPGETLVNGWGMTIQWLPGQPGPMPLQDEAHLLLPDIRNWRDVLKRPDPSGYSDAAWAPYEQVAAQIPRQEVFAAASAPYGLFETLHFMMGMENCLLNFYREPQAMLELIDFLTEWEIDYAREVIKRLRPDALFHHDDWGSHDRLLFSPRTFEEFFFPAYRKIYGFWREHGVELIVHHSDSYGAELVPFMIEMGVDIFQGATSNNNIPELLRRYGGKISIHGGLDNCKYDIPGWSPGAIREGLESLFAETGRKYLIPGLIMGGPSSVIPGVYEAVSAEIESLNNEYNRWS